MSLFLSAFGCDGDTEPSTDSQTETGTDDTSTGDSGDTGQLYDLDSDGVLSDVDCDDQDPSTYPGAEEWCDSVDHDCDGHELADGVCGKGQQVEAIADTWIDGDLIFDLILRPASAGNLDGIPGDEVFVRTSHGGKKSLAVLALASSLAPGSVVSDEAAHLLMADDFSPVRWGGGGDHNGDGNPDAVIVTDAGWNGGFGAVNLLLGPSTDWQAESTIPDAATSIWVDTYTDEDCAEIGESLATEGDFNGDGLDDIIVAVDDGANTFFFIPGTDAPPAGETSTADTLSSATGFNPKMAMHAGDLDGDGVGDVLVSIGELYFLSGAALPSSGSFDIRDEGAFFSSWRDPCETGPRKYDTFTVGDWSGDGVADVVHSCAEDASATDFQDTIHILDGATLGSSPGMRLYDTSLGSWLTERDDTSDENWMEQFFVAPDLDGDFLSDVLVDNRSGFEDGSYEDQLHLHLSSDGIPGPFTSLDTRGHFLYTALNPELARVFAYPSAADVDGDGLGDLLLDVYEADPDSTSYNYRMDIVLGWDLPWHEPEFW